MTGKFFNPTVIAECCTFLAAIFLLHKQSGIWRLFIPVLFIGICAEASGWAWSYILHIRGNGWIFNINLIIYTLFYLWLLSTAAPVKRIRRVIFAAMTGFFVFFIVNAVFLQGITAFQSYTHIFGEIIILFICLYFFIALLNENEYRNIFTYAYFWLANALLLNALGNVVLFAFYKYITDYDKATNHHLYGNINYIINILLYGSFIISFICRRRMTKC